MNVYQRLIRPFMFRMEAEQAHALGKAMLRRKLLWELIGDREPIADSKLAVDLAGIALPNPVGLAAGFDKDAEMMVAFSLLGFGYVVPGSVRPVPAGDNPSPKLVRYIDRQSMINCQGMPSKGASYVAERLKAFRTRNPSTRVITNITGWNVEQYVDALTHVQRYSDGIELSLSCPNEVYDETVDFLAPDLFTKLIGRLNERRRVPLFVKIRNYNDELERDNRFTLIDLCVRLGVDGVTLPGAHIVPEPRLSKGRGNLSGRAVFPKTLQNVKDVYRATNGRIAIKALGGVFSGRDAYDAIAAGASSVELLTGLVYEGWSIAQRINRDLLKLLDQNSIPSLASLRGSAHSSLPATTLAPAAQGASG